MSSRITWPSEIRWPHVEMSRPTGSTRSKVAIVGFTQHKQDAPWQDTSWDLWGLNDLHAFLPDDVFQNERVTWFQLHRPNRNGVYEGARDPKHYEWLQAAKCPLFVWEPTADLPHALAYPIHEVLSSFPRAYFNNSVAEMIALAILMRYETIGLWGVDMATDGLPWGGEYAHQRPSCEWIIGVAEGMGIRVEIPAASELCKTSHIYGWDNIGPLRAKMLARAGELEQQEAEAVQQYENAKSVLHHIRGAKQNQQYILSNWMPGDGAVDDVARTPQAVMLEPSGNGHGGPTELPEAVKAALAAPEVRDHAG